MSEHPGVNMIVIMYIHSLMHCTISWLLFQLVETGRRDSKLILQSSYAYDNIFLMKKTCYIGWTFYLVCKNTEYF